MFDLISKVKRADAATQPAPSGSAKPVGKQPCSHSAGGDPKAVSPPLQLFIVSCYTLVDSDIFGKSSKK